MANNIDKFVTSTEHGAVDHTASPLNLLNTTAHALVDHTGVTGVGSNSVQAQNNGGALQGPRPKLNIIPSGAAGVAVVDNPGQNRIDITISATAEAFTSVAHATTDHTGIPGVGLTTKQTLVLPHGVPFQYWVPTPATPSAPGIDPTSGMIPLTVDSTFTVSVGDVANLGLATIYTNSSGNVVRIYHAGGLWTTSMLPRWVFKLRPTGAVNGRTVEFGLGVSGTTTLLGQAESISLQTFNGSSWVIERRVGSVTQTSTATGVTPTTAIYAMFNYTSTTSVTVSIYDVTTLALLHSTTFSGGGNVPTPDRLRIFASNEIFNLASILLSFGK